MLPFLSLVFFFFERTSQYNLWNTSDNFVFTWISVIAVYLVLVEGQRETMRKWLYYVFHRSCLPSNWSWQFLDASDCRWSDAL